MSAELRRRITARSTNLTIEQIDIAGALDAAVFVYVRGGDEDPAAGDPADVDAVIALAKILPQDLADQVADWLMIAKNAGRKDTNMRGKA